MDTKVKAKRQLHKYTEENLRNAIQAIRDGANFRQTCIKFGVPRSTVQDRIQGRVSDKPRHYKKKEMEKLEKENTKKRRREDIDKKKQLNKIKKPAERTKILNAVGNNIPMKEKCGTCTEDLYSDAEDDAEKNLGCDVCPKWFHLRCTRYLGRDYDEVAQEDFICDFCNE